MAGGRAARGLLAAAFVLLIAASGNAAAATGYVALVALIVAFQLA